MSRAVIIFALFFCWHGAVFCISTPIQANTLTQPIVLMIGIEQNLLKETDRERFASFKIITRPYMLPDEVSRLVSAVNPSSILIRQPSGGLYEYSPSGEMIRQLTFRDSREEYLQKQSQDNQSNAPIQIYPLAQKQSKPGTPIKGADHMTPPYPGSHTPQGQVHIPMQGGLTNLSNPADLPRIAGGGVILPAQHTPYFGAPFLTAPPIPATTNPIKTSQLLPHIPQGQMLASNQNAIPNYIAPNYYNRVERPLPGGNVPSYMFPGQSRYSWLPGEGFDMPSRGVGISREIISQAATLAQQNFYPLWYQSFLNTNLDFSNVTTTASNSTTGFPNLTFSSDQTANFAVTSTQVAGSVLGIGSQLVDSFLQERQLKQSRDFAQRHSDGIANYYYPRAATTSYPSMRTAPITSPPIYSPSGY
ncbi:MAG: hypothetical protein SFT81_03845 [Candidatus Caenarcaniphilales bacterium]|nr:hypothetical protein [Candidatus Caenarcaniphilales bacterium]